MFFKENQWRSIFNATTLSGRNVNLDCIRKQDKSAHNSAVSDNIKYLFALIH